jgi:hypothetical protein
VTDDWPEDMPVTEAEIEVFEAWFGDCSTSCSRRATEGEITMTAPVRAALYRSGAPRPMKMGTIASPWRYDVAAPPRAPIGKSATHCDFALRLVAGRLADIARCPLSLRRQALNGCATVSTAGGRSGLRQ